MTAPTVGSQIASRFVASDDAATHEQLRAAIDQALSRQPDAALLEAARDFEWFGRLEIQPGQRGLAQAHDKMRTALESQPVAAAGDAVRALSGKYSDVLAPFVCRMERELHANAGKGDRPGWLAMSADTALLEIYYHVAKLQKAVRDEGGDLIAEHAADVANMAMMLLDVCGAVEAAWAVYEKETGAHG